MYEHLMRRPFELPLKSGGSVLVKGLSLRQMGLVLAEEDSMRRIAMAVQRSVLNEDGSGLLAWQPDELDYVLDELDQRVLSEIGMFMLNGPPEGDGSDADPLSDLPATTPTDAE